MVAFRWLDQNGRSRGTRDGFGPGLAPLPVSPIGAAGIPPKETWNRFCYLRRTVSTRRGAGDGSGASDGGLALRDVRQRRRSRTRTGAFDTRAAGMDGDRSRAVSSRGSQRDCGAGAILRIAGTVVAAGGAELPDRFRIVRVRSACNRRDFGRELEGPRRAVSAGCGAGAALPVPPIEILDGARDSRGME